MISLFSFLGIMLGVAILIIVMSVMNGFRTDLTNKILGLNPHVVIEPNGKNIITLKKDVLDPQGKVIQQTLDGMGFEDINEVRQGKYFEIDTNEKDKKKAEAKVEEMCQKLLANLVIENYKIIGSQ